MLTFVEVMQKKNCGLFFPDTVSVSRRIYCKHIPACAIWVFVAWRSIVVS